MQPKDPLYDAARAAMLQQEIMQREMLRKSLDTYRVYNPLPTPFRFHWDRYSHTVPAQSTKDMPRYLAMHYAKKISAFMIGQQQMKEGDELKQLRERQMGRRFLDKYDENVEIWEKVPKLDDPDLLREIGKIVLVGVVEEYGIDNLPDEQEQTQVTTIDHRSSQDQIFASFDQKIPSVAVAQPKGRAVNPFADLPKAPQQQDLLKEVTQDA